MIERIITTGKSKGKKRKVVLGTLDRKIVIPAVAQTFQNNVGHSVVYGVQTVEILIGIGKDNTATLIMTVDAHEALLRGETITVS